MIHMPERMQDIIEYQRRVKESLGIDLRVAAPGIIQSVDYEKQTCTVQLAIREQLNYNGDLQWLDIPVLPDVPFFIYSGGGYCLTLPVNAGDECLIVFGDTCIDAWWQSGGVQNQIDHRRHDLSDGFAIVGFRSQPNRVNGFSSDSAQLRNASGSACIEIAGDTINIRSSNTTIDGVSFLGHTHKGVETGGGNTGGVNA
nr:MAG TPA: baseplate component [Caudoviricetes sp.]